jgi:threonylcarbamoyladenosine tRNA methylthiotransferase MtaB
VPAKRIHFQALGCRLNEAELQAWIRQVRAAGHEAVRDIAAADLVVLNTCAVTAAAARKSRQQIRRARRVNPAARLVVTGCYGTLEAQRVVAELGVDRVVDNRHKDRLVELLALAPPASGAAPPASGPLRERRVRAFVKVQDGCRYSCSYCIVTVARGTERSRPPGELLAEVRRLVDEGVREVVLTGVHTGGYGSDIGETLCSLVARLLESGGVPRLRLASLEPWEISDAFFELFAHPRLMPHLHLPLQSGADTVLRRMARRGGGKAFRDLVRRARSRVPGINITTDIIAGFPGETAAEWRQTLALVEELGFGDLHVFPFSPRAGTRAAGLPGQLPAALVQERCRELLALGERLRQARLQARTGQTAAVLFEGAAAGKALRGYTPDYLRVVLDGTDDRGLSGSIRPVRLEAVADGQLRGRLVAG